MKTLKLIAWQPPVMPIPRAEFRSKLPAKLADKIPSESPRKTLSAIQKALPRIIDEDYAQYTRKTPGERWSIIGVPGATLDPAHVCAISIRLTTDQDGGDAYDRESAPLGSAFMVRDQDEPSARGPAWIVNAVDDAYQATLGKIPNANLKKIIEAMLCETGAWSHAKGTWLAECDGVTIPAIRAALQEYGGDLRPMNIIVGLDPENTEEVITSFVGHIQGEIQRHVSRIHESIEEQRKFVEGEKKQPIRFKPLETSSEKIDDALAQLDALRHTLAVSMGSVGTFGADIDLLEGMAKKVKSSYQDVMLIDRKTEAVPSEIFDRLTEIENELYPETTVEQVEQVEQVKPGLPNNLGPIDILAHHRKENQESTELFDTLFNFDENKIEEKIEQNDVESVESTDDKPEPTAQPLITFDF